MIYKQLPEEVKNSAKNSLLDALCTSFAGRGLPPVSNGFEIGESEQGGCFRASGN